MNSTKLALIPIVFGLAFAATSVQAQERACSRLANWADGPADLTISEARFYTDRETGGGFGAPGPALAPHCHVEGSFAHRTGRDGRAYAIRFAINLPENWNGRMLFQGGGGLNGSVGEPLGNTATGGVSAFDRGFAVISTDSGHQGEVFDGSFLADQQAMLDFYDQANAKVTELAQPIIESYYRDTISHNYFVGCSTGGREGMIMAQRYPTLFDGIVSGAPAMQTGISNLALRWISVELGKVPGTDARDPLTDQEEELVMTQLLAQCDGLDGNDDGLIFNRQSCDFSPQDLACSVVGDASCLADDKAAALARAFNGPVTSTGHSVYVSFPWDTAIDDSNDRPGAISGLLIAGGSPPEGTHGADMVSQDVDAEYIFATSADEALGNTATQTRLSTFIQGGGKHVFYHGEGDPWFSANDTVRYFEAMASANADVAPIEDYGRLYLVPGMAHCSGGDQTVDNFDLLTPLVDWVESAVPPGSVEATGASMPGQSRPVCPWPTYAHFNGGDAAQASSYSCELP